MVTASVSFPCSFGRKKAISFGGRRVMHRGRPAAGRGGAPRVRTGCACSSSQTIAVDPGNVIR